MKRSRQGSVTLFIMVFILTMVSMIMTFVYESREDAVKSTSHFLGNLWCESVLAEYDFDLRERYNIFGFYGDEHEINNRLDFYANKTYGMKKYISYGGVSCSLYEHRLANVGVMKKQIVHVGKLLSIKKIVIPKSDESSFYPKSRNGHKGYHSTLTEPGEKRSTEKNERDNVTRSNSETDVKEKNAEIRNEKIIASLPSNGSKSGITVTGLAGKLKLSGSAKYLFQKGTDQYFEMAYIMNYFKSRLGGGSGESFFDQEIEYIVAGKTSDAANQRSVRRKIVAVREIANLAFVVKDPKMQAELVVLSQSLTPGPFAEVTKKLLTAGWALAESYNDYQLLVNGKKVPAIKTADSWAIDLESIIKQKPKKEGDLPKISSRVHYIDPGNKIGDEYEDYIKLMLYVTDEDVRLLRIMDLIQINMIHCYNGDFRLRDYSDGLKVRFHVNGDDCNIEKEYQPV